MVSSQASTVEKKSLKRVAISGSEHTVEPLEVSSSVMLGCIFVLELMYRQKLMLLVYTSHLALDAFQNPF